MLCIILLISTLEPYNCGIQKRGANLMNIIPYEPEFPSVTFFLTRFFVGTECIFEQETTFALPTLSVGDELELRDRSEYIINKRQFAFHEDAFITVYVMSPKE